MISTEQTRQIAEYIWQGVTHDIHECEGEITVDTGIGTFDFDPTVDDGIKSPR